MIAESHASAVCPFVPGPDKEQKQRVISGHQASSWFLVDQANAGQKVTVAFRQSAEANLLHGIAVLHF